MQYWSMSDPATSTASLCRSTSPYILDIEKSLLIEDDVLPTI